MSKFLSLFFFFFSAVQNLPKQVNDVKICANQAFEQQDYNLAISLYNSAIVMCPNAACLYANRAAAYIKRAWYVFFSPKLFNDYYSFTFYEI